MVSMFCNFSPWGCTLSTRIFIFTFVQCSNKRSRPCLLTLSSFLKSSLSKKSRPSLNKLLQNPSPSSSASCSSQQKADPPVVTYVTAIQVRTIRHSATALLLIKMITFHRFSSFSQLVRENLFQDNSLKNTRSRNFVFKIVLFFKRFPTYRNNYVWRFVFFLLSFSTTIYLRTHIFSC